ncbi:MULTISPECIES: septation protein A [Janthinobacterium]|jgi:intracellular septation protein|uniref:Inner membrane-spanning protein YciB n=4 Tax=Janthinobacterium TaxID=29580 RepID=A0A6I1IHD0_9BURK|nr:MULTISPECIES: septation protein A [Janthinobacterium]MBH1983130.1 septation protein A [Burkholderiales bacterium]AQR69661.1 septation protein A [Janthinobacterium sp. LM6]ATD61552.1 septation protein A [Janthinobacterium svalbardensis]KAB8052655.1 septation protein A [Janthinobacterium sp. FT68W]KAB8061423.1 septation protein A [Janthinobacterium sp. FT14W]
MKFLFDLFPLIAFFAAFKLGGMYEAATHDFVQQYLSGFVSGGLIKADQAPWILATLVGIVATACQVSYLLLRGRKVDGMLWLSLFIFVVFGGASIYLHDDFFLKWKPTLIYWLSGLALLIAHVGFKKNLIRKTMEAQVQLPDAVWNQLLAAWIIFFGAIGALNLFVAFVLYKGDMAAWVSFKAFGATGIFFAFIVAQTLFLAKHIKEDA